ncbi:MAG TPA: HAD hydrolase family protein [Candidatus Cloacimonadota bacterium]|nr:HAD hydrolase family protein [Candidatus Cloacimonadota bacterium]
MINCLIRPSKRPVAWNEIRLLVLDCDGVLTNGKIIYGNNEQDIKQFHAADGMGLMLLRETPIEVAVISGRSSQALSKRCEDLQIKILRQGVAKKLPVLSEILEEKGLDFDNVVYMGDDWNDIPPMRRAALSVCPSSALAEIKKVADMVTEHSGGEGAVRELVNFILQKKGLYERAINRYLESIGC